MHYMTETKKQNKNTIAARHGAGANKEYKLTFQKVSILMNAISNSTLFL